MGHIWKTWSHLEKSVTLRKVGHTSKNGSHLEKRTWVTLGKMGHIWKNVGHTWKKRYQTRKKGYKSKMGHTWKNRSHLQKMGHTCNNSWILEKWVTLGKMGHNWKSESHFKKWAKLVKMRHTRKNGSQLEKWVTFGKKGGRRGVDAQWWMKANWQAGSEDHLEWSRAVCPYVDVSVSSCSGLGDEENHGGERKCYWVRLHKCIWTLGLRRWHPNINTFKKKRKGWLPRKAE